MSATEADRFDGVVGAADPGLVVVTAAAAGERSGCLVGFHVQCSIEPRRYAIWLSKANHTYRVAIQADTLAVHFLSEDDHGLAELFGGETGDEIDKFERVDWTEGPSGVPLLDDSTCWFVGRRMALLDEGSDHVCITLDPVDVHGPAEHFRPLRRSHVEDIEPGHAAG